MAKQDVLSIPSGAIKSQGDSRYVELPGTPVLKQQVIEAGLSDDTNTEIVSGLKEGDQIIVRTVTASGAKTTTSAPSLFGTGGRNR